MIKRTSLQMASKRLTSGLAGLIRRGGIWALGIGCFGLVATAPVNAAEELIVTYGGFFEEVFSVPELANFVETGEVPIALRVYLRLANLDPEVVRNALDEDLDVSMEFLDRTLNSLPGEFLLFQIGRVVHTPVRRANIQALRAALVLSAKDDNRVSLLEFLQNYPTQEVYVDGRELAKFMRKVSVALNKSADIRRRLQLYVAAAKETLEGLVCECEPATTRRTVSPDSDGGN